MRGGTTRAPGAWGMAISDALEELYGLATAESFPQRAITAAARLVDSDITSYNVLLPGSMEAQVYVDPPEAPTFPDAVAIFASHLDEHPLVTHYARTGDVRAHRISDLCPDRTFRATGLYREFYGPLGVDYQLAVTLPSAARTVVGIALNRKRPDFCDAERDAVNLLRRHFARAHANALALSRLVQSVPTMTALEAIDAPVIELDSEGTLLYATDCAARLAQAYLPGTERIYRLPELLVAWASREVVRMASGTPAAAPDPLVVPGSYADLVVRLVRCSRDDREGFLALLSESPRAGRTPLTARQREILELVGQGLSDAEIARTLGLSVRTVGKHLEHAYRMLGVTSRTAAIWVLAAGGPNVRGTENNR
ncbi:MAG: helix-turn-helix transcriptional regulator [Actinomycetota bacterium]|nr:helix-turn-helix transcriptional regulator [Actinomycetota bacterium]